MTTASPVRTPPQAPRRPVPLYGRRGRLPEDAPRACCACGKLIFRGDLGPGGRIEGYCRECRTHVVFET